MFKTTLASLAIATSLLACKDPAVIALPTPPAMPTEATKPGQMTVTGTATLEVSPDCADLTMTISADGARPGLATKGAQAKQQALLASLAKLGVESSDIKLSYLSLNPIFAMTSEGVPTNRVASYRSDVIVTVTTKKFELIGEIMEAGGDAGASSMSSQFRRSNMPELKKQVREMALAAAKDKAAQTAKVLGIRVGRVVAVNEAPAGMMWSSHYFPNDAGIRTTGSVSIGGALQPLTLDITIGFELAKDV